MTPAEIAEHCVHIAELFLEVSFLGCNSAGHVSLRYSRLPQDDNTVDAQIYIKKASEVIHEAEDATLTLRYRVRVVVCFFPAGTLSHSVVVLVAVEQVSYARIQDSQRKFLEAALKYYQISQIKDEV